MIDWDLRVFLNVFIKAYNSWFLTRSIKLEYGSTDSSKSSVLSSFLAPLDHPALQEIWESLLGVSIISYLKTKPSSLILVTELTLSNLPSASESIILV